MLVIRGLEQVVLNWFVAFKPTYDKTASKVADAVVYNLTTTVLLISLMLIGKHIHDNNHNERATNEESGHAVAESPYMKEASVQHYPVMQPGLSSHGVSFVGPGSLNGNQFARSASPYYNQFPGSLSPGGNQFTTPVNQYGIQDENQSWWPGRQY